MGERAPPQSDEWLDQARIKTPPLQLVKIEARGGNFCCDAQDLFDDVNRDAVWYAKLSNLVEVAGGIDADYQVWMEKYSTYENWGYRTFPSPAGAELCLGDTVQTYHDLWVGGIWIGSMGKRARLHHVLHHCLELLDEYNPSEDWKRAEMHSEQVMEKMAAGMCASVPFQMGFVGSDGQLKRKGKAMPLGGYLTMCPLHMARWSVAEGSPMDDYLKEVQRFISTRMGLRAAGNLATKVRKERWKLI